MKKLEKIKYIFMAVFITVCIVTGKTGIIYGDEITNPVLPLELDLGDYNNKMKVGERQLLYVTVLPSDAETQSITYYSQNENVATINGMGRITACSVGTTVITARCGDIEETFLLTVESNEEENETETNIEVTEIEIADYEKELNVGTTMTLTATVLPGNATDTTVTYTSSNADIATVNSNGEIKGISSGNVIITLTAGNYSKNVEINVKVGTNQIELNSTYVVLKKGETYQITGKAKPDDANQMFSFKSHNGEVANVSETGLVTAKSIGNTTIVVSNGDLSNAVTVIVNDNVQEKNIAEPHQAQTVDLTAVEKTILEMLEREDVSLKELNREDISVLTSVVLQKLYETKKSIKINGSGYSIIVGGEDIVNIQNELSTLIEFDKKDNGIYFVINDKNNLPGMIQLQYEEAKKYKNIYLYNEAKKKYEKLNIHDMTNLNIDKAGMYLLTNKDLNKMSFRTKIIFGMAVVLILSTAGYILVKKRYWFW